MKLIILDRDGVINQDPVGYISTPDDWHPFPGSLEAIAKLNKADIIVTVCSNQSGIGRGFFTTDELNKVHRKMHELLMKHDGYIDSIFYCPHHPDDDCECRKPKTKLLEDMSQQFNVKPNDMLFIGDSACDIETAKNFGCDGRLVLTGNGSMTAEKFPDIKTYKDLLDAVNSILEEIK